jgi:hypothetical protein
VHGRVIAECGKQRFTTRRPAARTGHVDFSPGLVDKDSRSGASLP